MNNSNTFDLKKTIQIIWKEFFEKQIKSILDHFQPKEFSERIIIFMKKRALKKEKVNDLLKLS